MADLVTKPAAYVSIRELANRLGISKGTVSLALNDSPRVKESTVKRVKAAAKAAGYQRNAMVSTMMSSMRKSAMGRFREVVALLNGNKDKDAFKNHPTLPQYKAGIDEEAAELGFKIDEFWLLDPQLTRKKLSAILHARGIRGCIIMGHTEEGVFEPYSKIWDDFKIVSVGISVHNPAYELVSSNQFEVAKATVENLYKMGFRRPAFIVDERIDGMVDGRFYGGFFRAQFEMPRSSRIDPFTENLDSPTYYENLVKYIGREEPDVLIYMLGKTGDFLYKKVRRKDGTRYPARAARTAQRLHDSQARVERHGAEQPHRGAPLRAQARDAAEHILAAQPEFHDPHSADMGGVGIPQKGGGKTESRPQKKVNPRVYG